MKPSTIKEKILVPFATTALLLGAVACGEKTFASSQALPPLSSEPFDVLSGSEKSLNLASGAQTPAIGAQTTPAAETPAPTGEAINQTEVVPTVSIAQEPEINPAPVTSKDTLSATNPTAQEATAPEITKEAALKEGVYCGPRIEDVMQNPQEVISILKTVNITEVHPPCTSAYGREGIGEGLKEVRPGISLTRANQIMLELGKQNSFKYYVDEPRFLSGDLTQIQAAYDDYKDWAANGGASFGIELPDEMQPPQIAEMRPALVALKDFMKAQNLDITKLIRFNLANVTETVPEVVRNMVDIFGPNVKLGIDAYTTEPKIWKDINAAMNQPGYEIKDWSLAVKGSQWQRLGQTKKNAAPTPQDVAKYFKIALKYQQSGAGGVYDFTGFAAVQNIFNEVFDGDLSQPENLAIIQQGRQLAGVGPDNKFPLNS